MDRNEWYREKETVKLKDDVDKEIMQARIAHQNIVSEAKKLYDQKISQVQKDKKDAQRKAYNPQT